jgi:D-alanine transfer protein
LKRLIAVVLAIALVCVPIAMGSPASSSALEKKIADAPYQIWPAKVRSNSPAYVRAAIKQRNAQGDNCKVVLGTSEFRWVYPDTVSSHPANFFGNNNYGMDTFLLGQPYCQDLWHAIEVGALSEDIPDDKVVFFCGITWFMDYQNPAKCFRLSFSPEAYADLMANPKVTDETKAKIQQKMIAYGVEEAEVYGDEAKSESLVECINNGIQEFFDDSKNWDAVLSDEEDDWNAPERELNRSRPVPDGRTAGQAQTPDWDAWLAQEKAEGADQTSSNEMGIYNSWYENGGYDSWRDGWDEWLTFTDEPYQETEFEDFELFLDVCKETGIEPLVVLMPLKGAMIDQTDYTPEVRALWYDRMKAICEKRGVAYVDYSPYEYDPYFLYDMAHFGWTGWVQVNRDIYEFFMGKESQK